MSNSYELVSAQQCLSAEGWAPVKVPSSDGFTEYTVLVNPWSTIEENICQCEGYQYRGTCRHQQEAMEILCQWTEVVDQKFGLTEQQTEEEEINQICPRCGGRTKWTMEIVYGSELK